MTLHWKSSLVWFLCPVHGCLGLIRATVTGTVAVDGSELTTTAVVDREAFDLHMSKNHGPGSFLPASDQTTRSAS